MVKLNKIGLLQHLISFCIGLPLVNISLCIREKGCCAVDSTINGVPIGIEDFEELRTDGFYYVDKTGLIVDLLKRRSKVTLITRPRRFGKTST